MGEKNPRLTLLFGVLFNIADPTLLLDYLESLIHYIQFSLLYWYLGLNTFTLTDFVNYVLFSAPNPKDADIIWTSVQVDEEVKRAIGLKDHQYINQFPFEACLVMKHHLAETVHKVSNSYFEPIITWSAAWCWFIMVLGQFLTHFHLKNSRGNFSRSCVYIGNDGCLFLKQKCN